MNFNKLTENLIYATLRAHIDTNNILVQNSMNFTHLNKLPSL